MVTLNEMFNTVSKIAWEETTGNLLGEFTLDNKAYQIDLNHGSTKIGDEVFKYLDIGFRKNYSSGITNDHISPRVLGTLVNGVKSKIVKLDPDFICFGVIDKDGDPEGRRSLYQKMSFFFSKLIDYEQMGRWIDIKIGKYGVMPKRQGPTKDQTKGFEDWLVRHSNK
jgi:hypothetical protein